MAFESNQVRWAPPEGLSYSGPRPVRLSGQGLVLVCLSGIFALCASIIGPLAFRAIQGRIDRDTLLSKQGVAAVGTVTKVWKESGKTPTPMVSYRFVAPGGEFTGQSGMRAEVWRGIQPGESLVVRYLPSRPEVNQPAQGIPNPPPAWLAWMPTLMFLWPPIMFWFMIRAQWRLLADGVPVRAVVTRINRSKKTNAYYEFKIPAGTAITGKSVVSGRSVPDVGAQVCVLYNPENPRKNSLYPLEMVKLPRE
jgi:Protein of unknown function (DUF3592)